jgi:hypothetical protein
MLHLQTGRRGRWLPVPLAAGLVLLAACGGSDPATPATNSSTAASATASAPAEGGGEFAECMTEQGVPAPQGRTTITGQPRPEGQPDGATRRNGPPPPDGVDPEAWDAALEACSHLATRRTATPTP